MKAHMMLFAGAITGLSMLAAPALSQERPTTPPRPSTSPNMANEAAFKRAMEMLEGTWQVSAKLGGDQGQAFAPVQGTSTRRWILDDKILQEEIRTNGGSTLGLNDQVTPGQPSRPGAQPDRTSALENFQGHGMFGYDRESNQFQHVWADSRDSRMCFSSGRYDERTRTFTFNAVKGSASAPPATRPMTPPTTRPDTPPSTPPTTPPTTPSRPGGNPTNPDDLMSQVTPGQPGQPGQPVQPGQPQTPRPGLTQPPVEAEIKLHDISRIVIRILDENRHVIEYFGVNQQDKLMEVTYTKGGAGR